MCILMTMSSEIHGICTTGDRRMHDSANVDPNSDTQNSPEQISYHVRTKVPGSISCLDTFFSVGYKENLSTFNLQRNFHNFIWLIFYHHSHVFSMSNRSHGFCKPAECRMHDNVNESRYSDAQNSPRQISWYVRPKVSGSIPSLGTFHSVEYKGNPATINLHRKVRNFIRSVF